MLENIFSTFVVTASMMAAAVLSPFGGAADRLNTQIKSAADRAALTRVASSTTIGTSTIACVATAVQKREQSIVAAHGSLSSSVTAAYTTRASELQKAYTLGNNEAIRAAVQAAWKNFNSSTRTAQKTWKGAQDAAWKQFHTAIKACRAPGGVTDAQNASLEVRGE